MQRVLRRLNRLDRILGYFQSQCKKVTAQWSTRWANPVRRLGYAGWLAWPLGLVSIVLLLSITYFVVGFGTLLIALVPLVGMPSGATTAQQEVIHPVGCLGQLLQKPEDAERLARCVRIKRDGQEIARGYLVDYSAGRVFLYLPCTKQAISLSLERTAVEHVRTLEFANPGKDCRVQ